MVAARLHQYLVEGSQKKEGKSMVFTKPVFVNFQQIAMHCFALLCFALQCLLRSIVGFDFKPCCAQSLLLPLLLPAELSRSHSGEYNTRVIEFNF